MSIGFNQKRKASDNNEFFAKGISNDATQLDMKPRTFSDLSGNPKAKRNADLA